MVMRVARWVISVSSIVLIVAAIAASGIWVFAVLAATAGIGVAVFLDVEDV